MSDGEKKTGMCLRGILIMITVGLAAALLASAGCGSEKAESRKDTPQIDVVAAETVEEEQPDTSSKTTVDTRRGQPRAETTRDLPRLVDLGKDTCIPCKKMAPILGELRKEYDGKAVIEVIDLRDVPEAAKGYGIRLIPTQIFFDAEGKEVWRHEGFLPKDQITAKFAEMGVRPSDD
jgi:thioredoxin 1